MLNLLTSAQMRLADQFTIENEPVLPLDLMERASLAFADIFVEAYPDTTTAISVYCGTGNNGGDGLAIARLLKSRGFSSLTIKVVRFSSKYSPDFEANYQRARETGILITEITERDPFPVEDSEVIVDAILGSGLNKPLEQAWKELVIWLRSLNRIVVSVDVPTGLPAEGSVGSKHIALKSDLTISFQQPKINFLLPDSAEFIDEFRVADIGLNEDFIQSLESPYKLLGPEDISSRIRKRKPFSHKGSYGHSLIIAGAAETMGAALLCSEACLRTGAGLTTACIPSEGLTALNVRVPEVMASLRVNGRLPEAIKWDKYTSVGIGPGLGMSKDSKSILEEVLNCYERPLVIDADALNLLAQNPELLSHVPEGSVFTPHMKEFNRLFGEHQTWWDRLETGIQKAVSLKSTIILKNRYTIIFTPGGKCLFNPTGTPAMASGGMGDVLTGMVASFLAQGYASEDAAILGVYLHGAAGERAVQEDRVAVVPAGRILNVIPKVIFELSR